MTEAVAVAKPDELRKELVVAFVVRTVLTAPSGSSPKAP